MSHYEVIKGFERWLRVEGCSDDTRNHYTLKINEFLKLIKINDLDILSNKHVIDFIDVKMNTCQQNSIATYKSAIRKFLEYLAIVALNDEQADRFSRTRANIKVKRYKTIKKDIPDNETIEKIIAGTKNDLSLYLALNIFYRCGLRKNEFYHLTWGDIGLDRIRITHAKGGEVQELPLGRNMRLVIQECRRGQALTDSLWPYSKGHIYNKVSEIGRDNGVELTPHILRHVFGNAIWTETGDSRKAQIALRHKSVVTTEIYLHIKPEDAYSIFNEVSHC